MIFFFFFEKKCNTFCIAATPTWSVEPSPSARGRVAPGHPREGEGMEGCRERGMEGEVVGCRRRAPRWAFLTPTDVELHGNHTCCASSSGRPRLPWRGAGRVVGGGGSAGGKRTVVTVVRYPPPTPTPPLLLLATTTTTRRRRRKRNKRRRRKTQQGRNGNVVRTLTTIPGYFHLIPSFRWQWQWYPPLHLHLRSLH